MSIKNDKEGLKWMFPIEERFEILNKKSCKYLDEKYISTVLETLGAQKFINLVNNMPDNTRKNLIYRKYFSRISRS